MVGVAQFRLGAGHGGIRIFQVGRRIGRAANFAVVAVLILGVALRALALDETVRQEHVLERVVELFDGAHLDQSGRLEFAVDGFGVFSGFCAVGAAVVVERHMEAVEVCFVLMPHAVYQLFRRDAFLLGAQHDRRAVGVVGAHVVAFVPLHLLEAHPDVGLDVFDQVAEVNAAVGVGQRGGDEDFSFSGHCG